jgi:hypothetical protein
MGPGRAPSGNAGGGKNVLYCNNLPPPREFVATVLKQNGESRVKHPDGIIRHRECLFIWIDNR